MDLVLILQAGISCFLCGLSWTIQGVHYPLFSLVGREHFPVYAASHQTRISRVVIGPMLAEVGLAGLTPWLPGVPSLLAWSGLALVAALWLVTWLGAVPCHRVLSHSYDAAVHRRLLRLDRVRTGLWTGRALLTLGLLT